MTEPKNFHLPTDHEPTIHLNTDGNYVKKVRQEDSRSYNRSGTEAARKPRKKRKTYSCEVCRKFKTRCDFEPLVGRCHRCSVLKIQCSLTKEREEEILAAIETSSSVALPTSGVSSSEVSSKDSLVSHPVATTLNNRLNKLESNLNRLNSKLDLLVLLAQGSNSAAANSVSNLAGDRKAGSAIGIADLSTNRGDLLGSKPLHNRLDDSDDQLTDEAVSTFKEFSPPPARPPQRLDLNGLKLQEPPLKLISDIDERLFPTKVESERDRIAKTQRPFVVARVNFLKFFDQHEQLCLDLSRDFLVKSHFWIIPGGIKEIDRSYVEKHLFISSVFAIIAMGFDENNKYEEEQEIMYPLVERLLTNTLTMFEKLTDHDIEAILYCSMFNVSRKSKRHRQMKLNSLVLTNFAISSLLNIIDFHKIKERVLSDKYDSLDLYHLRILNSLTACRLQYSIGYGNFMMSDDLLKDFNNLTARFPQATFGDDIKISEINLSEIVNNIFLNFKTYFKEFTISFKNCLHNNQFALGSQENLNNGVGSSNDTLAFPELEYWLKNWDELLSKDGGGVLLFAFNYYYIMICRSFLTEFYEEYHSDLHYFKCILKTMKNYCFQLLDGFLKLPSSLIKGAPVITVHQLVYACLTLCDFLHFFDASERQQILNLCTKIYWHLHTIGEKLNEATENVGKIINSLIDTGKKKVHAGSDPFSLTEKPKHARKAHSILKKHTVSDSQNSPHSVESSSSHNSGIESATGAGFNMPDVGQFNSFEDFFQDFFENLKPTTQNIFSSMNQTPK
ncbi:Uracil catabolism protein 2 [Lachancea thermotolerans]